MAASGSDRDGNACCLCRAERSGRPVAELLREGRQKRSIHVNRHQANRKVHGTSLPAAVWTGAA
jgi:hypothetical protein